MTPMKTPAPEYAFMALIRRAALTAFAALVPALAFGQPPPGYPDQPPPVRLPQPPAQTTANGGVALPPAATSAPPPATYPPGYYNPYGYPAYQGPVGGALSGYADVVAATGQYQIANQQSRIIQTQADMSRIDYRNALIQQQRYEQSLRPTTEELRQQEQWRKLQSARNNPTNPEVWSGASLNSLLTAMQGAEVQGLRADPVLLPADVLKHLNFSTGTDSGAGAGMLKEFTDLQWPFALQDQSFQDGVTKINGLATKAVDEVKSDGRVSATTFRSLDGAVTTLRDTVHKNQTLSPADWIESTSFLDELRGSVQSLRNPNVAQYFGGKYSPKASTVDGLVREMTSQGLRFAPAAQGDQPSYTAMQQLMRSYDYRLATLASR